MSSSQPKWRTLLVLARASNLPTVWSNCLAGWILGGGGDWLTFTMLCLGASFLYVGGMFLNDAFDAGFDRQFRKERPIPSGAISAIEVWGLGVTWLVVGVTCVFWMGPKPFLYAMLLVGSILLYDWSHKKTVFSPVPMAACRFLLYLLAASAARVGVGQFVVVAGLAMASYIIGLSYIAKAESAPGPLRFWPCAFLAVPLAIAGYYQPGPQSLVFGVVAVVGVWVIASLKHILTREKQVGVAVSKLLAGIVLVDLLATVGGPRELLYVFAALFVAARVFQKFIPAT